VANAFAVPVWHVQGSLIPHGCVQAIERNGTGISYLGLLQGMYYTIASLHGGPAPPMGGFMGKLVDGAMDIAGMSGQSPCLCSNVPFDLNRPIAI
jgi:hypothetical protein